jgi:acyl carrier protein
MSEQVLHRVCEIAGDVLEAPVNPESTPDTVETWDSVRHLNLMLAIEEEYGFQFLPEEMDEAKSVGQIARLVAAKRG